MELNRYVLNGVIDLLTRLIILAGLSGWSAAVEEECKGCTYCNLGLIPKVNYF
jgi:hypothetical protein